MRGSQSTRRRRLTGALVAKAALTLALTHASDSPGPVVFRSLSALPGVHSGTPVTLSGMLVGRVVAKRQYADTTLLTVRFDRGAGHQSGDHTVILMPMDLERTVALEIQPTAPKRSASVARGGWLHVIPWSPPPHWPREMERPRLAPPEQPPLYSMPIYRGLAPEAVPRIVRPPPRRGRLAAA
jgi:hypothetical protein